MPFIHASVPPVQKNLNGLSSSQSPIKSGSPFCSLKKASALLVSEAVRFLVADMQVTPYNAWKREA